ncbi:EF hand protein (macronuclear) [Tetrahymena thermophila SB210]|uniref:EF hand protein n=1 Tax=Tetrahymena thermophila (strain SB210) TaxID=312017 RepID=I7MLF6_TETTS|nr:EF hand protein [Tetrahymena thermophila SB210]EAS02007.2 EF hand protein [Tetrahymena thermophila SB210]|eukprot:XP_001022252.2 EF hand protein [Tetrahymena thermophila SB210]
MASQFSDISRLSVNSAALIKSAYQLNDNKLYKMIEDIDDDTMHKIWGGLGLHISRQMRMGRGVLIHKFGLFTFGPTDFNKDGFASQKLREKQKRQPVFLVSADFVKGLGLKQSIYSEVTSQLRPYSLVTSGQVQQVTVNFSEISNLISVDPIKCKAGVNRMISTLASKINSNGQADLEIPGIGFLIVRNNMCGVNFHQSFIASTQYSTNLALDERKEKGEMTLTAANLSVLEYRNKFSSLSPEKLEQNKSMIDIASSVNSYLRNNLGINLQGIINDQKKQVQIEEQFSPIKQRNHNQQQKSLSFINENQFARDPSNKKKNLSQAEISHKSMKTQLSFQSEIYNLNKPMCQRIIQFWMRQNHLDAERGFIQLCEKGFASSKNFQFLKLDFQNFQTCIQQNEIKLTPELIQEAFKLLDEKQKNYIDYIDWQKVFGEYLPSQIRHLDYIRDVIFKKGLRTDDILKTCKLSRDSAPLNKKDLIQSMKQICLTIDDSKAEKIADTILSITGQSQISVHQLVQHLQSIEEDDKEHDPSWFKNLLWRLKLKFTDQELLEDLKQLFIQYDEHQQGLLDVASFKICMIKSKLKLSISEVNRMIRYLKKDSNERIDYFNFLQSISTIEATRVPKERIFDRGDFMQKLKNHYQQFESAEHFLKSVHKSVKLEGDNSNNLKVSYQKFAFYLGNNIFKDENLEFLESFVKQIDYSRDDFIDIYDIQQYIKNGKYIEQVLALPSQIKQNPMQTIDYLPAVQYDQKKIEKQTNNHSNSTFINNYTYQFTTNSSLKQNEDRQLLINNSPPCFPTNPLSEEMINLILRDLRKNIRDKKITFKQLFDLLDTDKNGMISCSEFMDGLDKYILLSQPVKDGFFAYMDKLHIGMIDISNFLKVLEKSVKENAQDQVTEDNWNWQNLMVQRIFEWYSKGHFTSEEEAFRVIDFEYKGFVDVQDFKKFLRDVLKIKENELTIARVNRLFKIIDFYKSGRIGIIDFIKFVKQQQELQQAIQNSRSLNKSDIQPIKRSYSTQNQRNISSSSSKQSDSQQIEILNVDWKKSVSQQLGLYISKHYPSIQANFENVSQYKKKITFDQFQSWVEKSNSLQGFDLTNTLLQELFAYFDPHKKGFLTESDWINQFGHINWKKQMVEELRNLIYLHFSKKSQAKEAFEFFLTRNDNPDNQKLIYLSGFYKGINYLYPKRFTFDEISQVWDREINQFSQLGMDFNKFLGFIIKNFNNNIQSSESTSKTNNQNSQIFQSQQSLTKNIDIFDSKIDSIRFRSYTPITVTGSKVSQSPKRQSRQKEQNLRQIIQGPKYVSPIKRNMSDLKKQDLANNISQNLQPRLVGIKNTSFFMDKSDLNDYYNSLSRSNLTGNITQQNSNSVQQNLSSVYTRESGSFLQQQGEILIQKLKRIIRSSSQIDLEEILNKNDIAQSGYLTNNQFKKALSELNLGLKSQEIFFLINLCGLDGRLQIKKFIELLQKSDEDDIIVKRCKTKLKQISSKIYKYMISPVDAFRQFNQKGDGKMSLQEFEALINKLQTLNGEPEEGLSVIKDMFGFLDRNQDGFIDSTEWNDVLSNLNTPQFYLGRVNNEDNIQQGTGEGLTRQKKYRSMSNTYHIKQYHHGRTDQNYEALQQKSIIQLKGKQNDELQERNKSLEKNSVFRITSNITQNSERNKQKLATQIKQSLDVKDHDLILNVLAKNRKYLLDLFQSYNQANIPITYDLAKSLIMKILNSQGIQIADSIVSQFIKFAERDGIIDYKLLLEVYKDRLQTANQLIKN